MSKPTLTPEKIHTLAATFVATTGGQNTATVHAIATWMEAFTADELRAIHEKLTAYEEKRVLRGLSATTGQWASVDQGR